MPRTRYAAYKIDTKNLKNWELSAPQTHGEVYSGFEPSLFGAEDAQLE